MGRNNMKEFAYFIFIMICCVFIAYGAYEDGKEFVYKEAIQNGCGEQSIDANKNVTFKWKK